MTRDKMEVPDFDSLFDFGGSDFEGDIFSDEFFEFDFGEEDSIIENRFIKPRIIHIYSSHHLALSCLQLCKITQNRYFCTNYN